MSEQSQNTQPSFSIQRVYLKDLSLEQPNAPAIFLETEQPGVEIQIDVRGEKLHEGVYQVVVVGTVTTRIKDKVVFLVEAHQAGIFNVQNIPDEQMDGLLGIACPTILYPYLRSNIADMITRAGYPPVHLAEINFQALYEQRLMEAAQNQSNTHTTH
jgi:preprotein translocase subunit SecB